MERSRAQRFVVLPALAVSLLLCLLICLPATAWAQDAPPSAPVPPGPAGDQPWQDPDGNWRMEAGPADSAGSTDVQAADAPAATGGPDDYGYTWNDGAAFSWIDATGGTDTGMSGYSNDQRVGPIPLPFSFKYYEGVYNNIYIAASGYVAFQDTRYWDTQVQTPSPAPPNTIISPYSTPLTLATKGKSGRVFYSSGGAAPNRYFVAAWNDVRYGNEDERYTFEVVLYENGDILFQYKTMTYNGDTGWYCGYVGRLEPEAPGL